MDNKWSQDWNWDLQCDKVRSFPTIPCWPSAFIFQLIIALLLLHNPTHCVATKSTPTTFLFLRIASIQFWHTPLVLKVWLQFHSVPLCQDPEWTYFWVPFFLNHTSQQIFPTTHSGFSHLYACACAVSWFWNSLPTILCLYKSFFKKIILRFWLQTTETTLVCFSRQVIYKGYEVFHRNFGRAKAPD